MCRYDATTTPHAAVSPLGSVAKIRNETTADRGPDRHAVVPAMEWYREQTIQLIDLFRARPALWDTGSVHYRNKRMKNDSLEQISSKLRCPKEEIAKKICTLRVQFSREKVKVKRAREAGTVYVPKWFGYQLLCFLNNQSRYSSTSLQQQQQQANSFSSSLQAAAAAVARAPSNAPSVAGSAQNRSDAENQQFQWGGHTSEDSFAEANDANPAGYEADSVLQVSSMMHEPMDDSYHSQEPIVDVQERSWSLSRRYRCGPMMLESGNCSDDSGGGGAYGYGRKMMRVQTWPDDRPPDEFGTFSDYVAQRMRNLKADKSLQLMARRDIEQVLFKYEMKLLEQTRDAQQPDTEAATTSKSISPSPVSSDLEQR